MRYGQIRRHDIANGPGIRTSFFVTGCTFNCPKCFNKEYQDFSYGKIWTEKETQEVIKYLKEPQVEGLTILGGEPMLNVSELTSIVKNIKEIIDKPIWIYSGFQVEKILEDEKKKELLMLCDVIVDGLFIESLKNEDFFFRGSTNQRIIKIKTMEDISGEYRRIRKNN